VPNVSEGWLLDIFADKGKCFTGTPVPQEFVMVRVAELFCQRARQAPAGQGERCSNGVNGSMDAICCSATIGISTGAAMQHWSGPLWRLRAFSSTCLHDTVVPEKYSEWTKKERVVGVLI
jgi:hypothetical protein